MNENANPFDLHQPQAYQAWRARKLAQYPQRAAELMVPISNPRALSQSERSALASCCQRANMALYDCPGFGDDKPGVVALGRQFGLQRLDGNLCADEDNITSLQVREAGPHSTYIPYSNHPIQWHTDGYYNRPEHAILGMVLHCARPALEGGENALLDHEMAYLQLRDENPAWIEALQHPQAMTIPANVVDGQEIRPSQTGPVFSVLPNGALYMRYTKRKRNIHWHPQAVQAAQALAELLDDRANPYQFRHRLQAGQGLICNNVLHDRQGFTNGETEPQQRLLFRGRYYDRLVL